jgi:hypothetical protein
LAPLPESLTEDDLRERFDPTFEKLLKKRKKCSGKKKPRDEEEEEEEMFPGDDEWDCVPFPSQDDISVEDDIPSQEDFGVDCKCIHYSIITHIGKRNSLPSQHICFHQPTTTGVLCESKGDPDMFLIKWTGYPFAESSWEPAYVFNSYISRVTLTF